MNIFKKAILVLTLAITGGILGGGSTYAVAPSFNANFANYLTDATPDKYGRVETVFSICIDRNISLMQNVKNLFYPNQVASGAC